MKTSYASRLPFLMAAAVVAAALADPVVESLSNAGVFGGTARDDNHLGVVPALVVGLLLAVLVAVMRCIDAWRSSPRGSAWFGQVARDLSKRSPAQDLPIVFALQLLALFALESGEQLATGGRMFDGLTWLGGPVAFSLAVHALFCLGCNVALGRLMGLIAAAFASVVRTVLRFVWLRIERASDAGRQHRARRTALVDRMAPLVRHAGGRAPPLLATPA